MTIIQSETSLSSDEYNALKAEVTNFDWRVVAYRWNLKFATAPDEVAWASGNDFDAINFNSTIYRITGSGVDRLVTGTWTSVAGWTSLTGGNGYSAIVDGTTLYVFGFNSSGISRCSYTTGGGWTSWSTVVSDATVQHIAAVTYQAVHYVVYDSTDYISSFKIATYSDSWSVVESDLWWQYEITSFDAVRLSDGSDALVISTDVPGITSAKYVNKQVVKTITRAGGIIAFTYKYETWSDHFTVDVMDEISSWRFRKYVRLSLIDDKLFLTSYCSDGTQRYSFENYRYYTTKDGKHWSRGEAFNLADCSGYGAILLRLGDLVYAVERERSWDSDSTLLTGTTPTATFLDISNEVENCSISRRDMMQATLTLNNATNWLSTSILNGTYTCVLKVYGGHWDEDDTYQEIQLGLLRVDTIGHTEDLPRDRVELTARDYLSLMTSYTQAEQFSQWEPQTAVGDEYVDQTDTEYGGLGNTAVMTASWRSIDGKLVLASSNKEGIATSTFFTEFWNGSHESSFTLSTVDNQEYAGLVFRFQDKDNTWLWQYNQESDTLILIEKIGGSTVTVHYESSTLSWDATPSTRRWLKVELYYATVFCYYSTDGITWTLEATHVSSGFAPMSYGPDGQALGTVNFIPVGQVGVFGSGYSDIDVWESDPPNIPPPTFVVPRPVTGDNVRPAKLFALGYTAGEVARARSINYTTNTVNWEDIGTGVTGVGRWASADPYNYFRRFLLTADGFWRCDDIWTGTPTFTQIADNTDVWGSSSYQGNYFMMSHNKQGWIGVVSGDYGFAYSPDYGATWTLSPMTTSPTLTATDATGGHFYISGWNSATEGHLYGGFYSGGNVYICKSPDWGVTWGSYVAISAVGLAPRIYVPYRKADGTPNRNGSTQVVYVIAGNSSGTNYGAVWRSNNGGASFTELHSYSGASTIPKGYSNRPIIAFTEDGSDLYLIAQPISPSNGYWIRRSRNSGDTINTVYTAVVGNSANHAGLNGFSFNRNFLLMYSPGLTGFGTSGGFINLSMDGAVTMDDITPSFFTNGCTTYAEADLSDYLPSRG